MGQNKNTHTILFFVLTFLWTWVCYGAIILLRLNPYSSAGMPLLILGGCSPTFVGCILAITTYPKGEKTEFFKRIYQLRHIRLDGWLIILLLFPAVSVVSIGIDLLLGGTLPQMTNLRAVIAFPPTIVPLLLLSFFSGPFSEEIGWRGFALDPLMRRFGFTGAFVLLGLIWGVWHLPLYCMPQTWHGKMGFALAGFPMFLLLSVGLCGIMSLVYARSDRSILSAMLLHLSSNFTAQQLEMVSPRVEILRSIIVFALGAAIGIYGIAKRRSIL